MADPNTGMDRAEMKKLLLAGKPGEPVKIAVAQGKDAARALFLVDKFKQPQKLEDELTAKFPEAKNARRGTAFVDPDDKHLIKIVVNKAAPNICQRLVKTLKGTGFTKVEIATEDGSFKDAYGEADENEQTGSESQESGAPEPPQAEAPAPDAGALQRALAGLIPRIPQVAGNDSALLGVLKKLAVDATTSLKTGNLETAAGFIEELRAKLDGGGAPSSGTEAKAPDAGALSNLLAQLTLAIPKVSGGDMQLEGELSALAEHARSTLDAGNVGEAAKLVEELRQALLAAQQKLKASAKPDDTKATAGAVAYGKARLAWLAARGKMVADIDKLRSEIVAHYGDLEQGKVAAELEQRYRERVAPVLDALDEELADKLDAATNATDPQVRGKLVDEAKAKISAYQTTVAGSEILAQLDTNPFVPLAIQKTLATTLSTIAAAVR
jgi:hypothetical protein